MSSPASAGDMYPILTTNFPSFIVDKIDVCPLIGDSTNNYWNSHDLGIQKLFPGGLYLWIDLSNTQILSNIFRKESWTTIRIIEIFRRTLYNLHLFNYGRWLLKSITWCTSRLNSYGMIHRNHQSISRKLTSWTWSACRFGQQKYLAPWEFPYFVFTLKDPKLHCTLSNISDWIYWNYLDLQERVSGIHHTEIRFRVNPVTLPC
jgi:hypothetical protein